MSQLPSRRATPRLLCLTLIVMLALGFAPAPRMAQADDTIAVVPTTPGDSTVAPAARLYALRVFGCGGGTNLTVQAIEWTMDPNGDGDLSDHLDVINMSLGSGFGGPSSTSTIAAENAARAGVIVVASAGNSGDTYFITGSPGASGRTISVAAVADDSIPAALLQVSAPAAIAGGYAAVAASFGGAPAPSGQTAGVVQALDPANGSGPLTTDGCLALTNAAAVAGNIALLDRGTCGFQVKVANAQAAGAIGAIVSIMSWAIQIPLRWARPPGSRPSPSRRL